MKPSQTRMTTTIEKKRTYHGINTTIEFFSMFLGKRYNFLPSSHVYSEVGKRRIAGSYQNDVPSATYILSLETHQLK